MLPCSLAPEGLRMSQARHATDGGGASPMLLCITHATLPLPPLPPPPPIHPCAQFTIGELSAGWWRLPARGGWDGAGVLDAAQPPSLRCLDDSREGSSWPSRMLPAPFAPLQRRSVRSWISPPTSVTCPVGEGVERVGGRSGAIAACSAHSCMGGTAALHRSVPQIWRRPPAGSHGGQSSSPPSPPPPRLQ